MPGVFQDVRYAARTLYKTPVFTLASMVVLALGIGATTTIFSLVDAALLRPLPFPESRQLVMVWERTPRMDQSLVSMANFFDWREQNTSFEVMAASAGVALTPLAGEKGGPPEAVAMHNVTAGYFEVLGVRAVAGRTFDAQDAIARNGPPLVVISDSLWRKRFGGDPDMIGRGIRLGSLGTLNTVIGIVPAAFQILGAADVWQLFEADRGSLRGARVLRIVARLKPGSSIDAARADLSLITTNIERDHPATNQGWSVSVDPLQHAIVGEELRTTTLVLAGVVLFVLLLVCANVANLILARGVGRTREMAVRAVLGGTRMRLARQLLVESALLGAIGGAAGLTVAAGLLQIAPLVIPRGTIPESIVLGIDWRLAAFAVIVTFATAVLFGLAPAWQAARVPLVEAMIGGNRGSTGRAGRLRHTLAVVEIAAALLLMTGAGLLLRTLASLDGVDAGYRAEHVVTMTLRVPFRMVSQAAPGELSRYFQKIEAEIATLPGVRVAAIGSDVPLAGISYRRPFEIPGEPAPDPANRRTAHYQMITPRYFEALGISLLRGRVFTERDSGTAVAVCIVNEAFARRFFTDRDPIGARITVQSQELKSRPVLREIVGVVRQIKTRPDEPAADSLQIYVPLAQNAWMFTTVVVRAIEDAEHLMPSIRAAVARVDPLQIVSQVRTMEGVAAESTARPRFRAQLVSAFAALAALLAAVGIFGLLTFIVQQRAREFSVRVAVGASAADLLRLVIGDGVKLTAIGLAVGLAASALLARSLATLLFGVTPFDPLTFIAAPALLATLALVACVGPAIRALRADPAAALKFE